MCIIRFLALLLIIVGALNWGLWGAFQYDAVASFLNGNTSMLARLVYVVVGIAGLYGISFLFCPHFYKKCKDKSESCK